MACVFFLVHSHNFLPKCYYTCERCYAKKIIFFAEQKCGSLFGDAIFERGGRRGLERVGKKSVFSLNYCKMLFYNSAAGWCAFLAS